MTVLDVDNLLLEVSADKPCGDNLEYDPAYGDMERAAQPKAEQQFGDTTVPAAEPDWRRVKELALELLSRTSDLRIVGHLCRAIVHTDGVIGFRDALTVLHGLIEKRWPDLHPELDPDDDNDPTMRINAIVGLCDAATVIASLREAPLCSSRAFGRLSYRDIQIARGDVTVGEDHDGEGQQRPSAATIDAAFMDADIAELQATATALDEAGERAAAVEATLTDLVGSANAPSMVALSSTLRELRKVMADALARRGVGDGGGGDDDTEAAEGEATSGAPRPAARGEINGPDDVIRVLDKVCSYYQRNEPSSPVPLLLARAKRLVSKDFVALLRDLAPEGLDAFDKIRGVQDED